MCYKKFLLSIGLCFAAASMDAMKVLVVDSDEEVTSSDTAEPMSTTEINAQLLGVLSAVKAEPTRQELLLEELEQNRREREIRIARGRDVVGKAPMLIVRNGVIQRQAPKPSAKPRIESSIFATSDIRELEQDLAFMQASQTTGSELPGGTGDDSVHEELQSVYKDELDLSDEELYSQTLVDLPFVTERTLPTRPVTKSRVVEASEEATGHQPLFEDIYESGNKSPRALSPRDIKKSRAGASDSPKAAVKKPLPIPGNKVDRATTGRSSGKKVAEAVPVQVSDPLVVRKVAGHDDTNALNSLQKVWLQAYSLYEEKMQDWKAAGKVESEFSYVQFPTNFEQCKLILKNKMASDEYQRKFEEGARPAKLYIEGWFWEYLDSKLDIIENYVSEVRN